MLMMLLPEKVPRNPVRNKIKMPLPPPLTRKLESQLEDPVMMVPLKLTLIKKLPLLSAHQSLKVCAEKPYVFYIPETKYLRAFNCV